MLLTLRRKNPNILRGINLMIRLGLFDYIVYLLLSLLVILCMIMIRRIMLLWLFCMY